MKNYEKEFEKFNLNLKDLPDYKNPEDFANNFKKCSLYKYGNITYTNTSNTQSLCKEK